MSYHVHTAVFEGPLDLLLQLITRRQVDITAVNLVDIVSEYLSVIEELEKLDLDVTSEFLLIAATLIQLKARHLLPTGDEFDPDEELVLLEERDRLLARLLQCVTFKDVAAVLAFRLSEGTRYVPRVAGLDVELKPAPVDVHLGVDCAGLARIATRVIARPTLEPDLDHLDFDLPSVQAALEDLRARIREEAETTFSELVADCQRTVEVVAYFLALLELARHGAIDIAQRDWLAEIEVKHRPQGATEAFQSEWGTS
jgi:segregation and condensation protein A